MAARAATPLLVTAHALIAAGAASRYPPLFVLSIVFLLLGHLALFTSGKEDGTPPEASKTTLELGEETLTLAEAGAAPRRIPRSRVQSAAIDETTRGVIIRLKDGTAISAAFDDAERARSL